MSDNLTPENRRKTMRAVRGKGTKPERQLWSMLAGMHVSGWRKNAGNVIGKPDVVFEQEKVAIFVDGCFWHRCPHCKRKLPETNKVYWERKISRNVELDQQHDKALRKDGWTVIRIWEHEMSNPEHRKRVRAKIYQALEMHQL